MTQRDFTRFKRVGDVGIASPEFQHFRSAAITKGEYDPPDNDPQVWVHTEEEFNHILKSPLHPRHARIRQAATQQQWKLPKEQQSGPRHKPYPNVDSDQADCVHRLLIILDEMSKPYVRRHAFVRAIVQESTRFDMNSVYRGCKDKFGCWKILSVHPIGLAALDPWFEKRGLCPSVIPAPGKPDSLDIGGVMVMTRKYSWRRLDLYQGAAADVFGIGEAHWERLCDSRKYPMPTFWPSITPSMVHECLHTMTQKTHAPKFTGAALPEPADEDSQLARAFNLEF